MAEAQLVVNRCTFEHWSSAKNLGQGQNLYTTSGDAFSVTAGIIETWYKKELKNMTSHFGAESIPDDVFGSVGHLTQMVWKNTTSVGCVSKKCENMLFENKPTNMNMFTVCNYYPGGNVDKQYASQVAPPKVNPFPGKWSD